MNRLEEVSHLRVVFRQNNESFKWKLIDDIKNIAIAEKAEELEKLCVRATDEGVLSDRLIEWILDAYALLDSKKVAHGIAFSDGRKKDSINPVQKKVRAFLNKHPKASAIDVWNALEKSPPKEHVFMNTTRDGRYIEKGAKTVMGWNRFNTVVSEQRHKK